VTTVDELREAVASPGPSVTRVVSDRTENVKLHDLLNRAVASVQR
jgi:hypothetical protein